MTDDETQHKRSSDRLNRTSLYVGIVGGIVGIAIGTFGVALGVFNILDQERKDRIAACAQWIDDFKDVYPGLTEAQILARADANAYRVQRTRHATKSYDLDVLSADAKAELRIIMDRIDTHYAPGAGAHPTADSELGREFNAKHIKLVSRDFVCPDADRWY